MKNSLYSPIQTKSFDTAQTELNGNTVMGYLASFGTKDLDDDVIEKGAFTKSLNDRGVNSATSRKIAYLYQHDMSKPIGKFTVLAEDSKGLYFEAELDDIQLAQDVKTQYKSGTLNQHSIGFQYIKDKTVYDDKTSTFFLKEVNLWEGSVVTFGMNENTPMVGMKGLDDYAMQLRKETDLILKGLPYDESYQLRHLINKYIALAKSEPSVKDIQHLQPQPFDWGYIINNLNK